MYGRFVHVFMSFHPIPSLLDPFLSFIPLERNIQAGLREDTNCEVNQAWGGNWNRFSMRVSCCLPGKFWIFCNLMFSVQNSLRKIGTMWVERGHFPLVLVPPPHVWTCTSISPSRPKCWQPLCLLRGTLSFSCEGSVGFMLCPQAQHRAHCLHEGAARVFVEWTWGSSWFSRLFWWEIETNI